MRDIMSEYAGESADAPEKDSEQPLTEEGSPEASDNSLNIPAEFLGGATFREGDQITMRVVSADEDGVEVEYVPVTKPASGRMSANDEIDQMGDSGMMS